MAEQRLQWVLVHTCDIMHCQVQRFRLTVGFRSSVHLGVSVYKFLNTIVYLRGI